MMMMMMMMISMLALKRSPASITMPHCLQNTILEQRLSTMNRNNAQQAPSIQIPTCIFAQRDERESGDAWQFRERNILPPSCFRTPHPAAVTAHPSLKTWTSSHVSDDGVQRIWDILGLNADLRLVGPRVTIRRDWVVFVAICTIGVALRDARPFQAVHIMLATVSTYNTWILLGVVGRVLRLPLGANASSDGSEQSIIHFA